MNTLVKPKNMKQKVEILLTNKGRMKKQLAGELGILRQTLDQKLSRNNFSEAEINSISKFFDVESSIFYLESFDLNVGQDNSKTKQGDDLMKVIENIEKQFSSIIEEKNDVIKNQKFIIDILKDRIQKYEPISSFLKPVNTKGKILPLFPEKEVMEKVG